METHALHKVRSSQIPSNSGLRTAETLKQDVRGRRSVRSTYRNDGKLEYWHVSPVPNDPIGDASLVRNNACCDVLDEHGRNYHSKNNKDVAKKPKIESSLCFTRNNKLDSSVQHTTYATTDLSVLRHQRKKTSSNDNPTQEPNIHCASNMVETAGLLENPSNITSQSPPAQAGTFFRKLYGPSFTLPSMYELITPPVIPDHLVVASCLADGVSPVVLGRGSFGRVIKGTFHDSLQYSGDIVIKEIFDRKNKTEAIYAEARTLLYLEKTGYVPICFGVVSDESVGHTYGILQECVAEGITLETYLWKGRRRTPSIRLLDIARQLTAGLREIHKVGVIINDIKANNVLVSLVNDIPKVKYCDMGLASYNVGRLFRYTSDSAEFYYLAPEVRYGGLSSFKSDIYSIGYVMDTIQNFGELDCLYPAIDKCIVREPDRRSDAEDLALIVAGIFDERCHQSFSRIPYNHNDSIKAETLSVPPTVQPQKEIGSSTLETTFHSTLPDRASKVARIRQSKINEHQNQNQKRKQETYIAPNTVQPHKKSGFATFQTLMSMTAPEVTIFTSERVNANSHLFVNTNFRECSPPITVYDADSESSQDLDVTSQNELKMQEKTQKREFVPLGQPGPTTENNPSISHLYLLTCSNEMRPVGGTAYSLQSDRDIASVPGNVTFQKPSHVQQRQLCHFRNENRTLTFWIVLITLLFIALMKVFLILYL